MGREAAHVTRRMLLRVAGAAATELAWAGLSGCAVHPSGDVLVARDYSPLSLDKGAWRHDEANDIYYQVAVSYCLSPAAPDFESLGVYVPGAYLSARANVGGETYTCSINPDGSIGGYTAATAPVVMPIDTVGFGAQEAPSSYSAEGVVPYTSAGSCMCAPAVVVVRAARTVMAATMMVVFRGVSPTSRRPCATCATTRTRFRAPWTASSPLVTPAGAPRARSWVLRVM